MAIERGISETAQIIAFPSQKPPEQVRFDRHELGVILGVYGRKVAAGEWRDYALDFGRDRAVFSIFRRTGEAPLYRIEKDPKRAEKQSIYAIIAPGGLILKRGNRLDLVLKVLEKPAAVSFS